MIKPITLKLLYIIKLAMMVNIYIYIYISKKSFVNFLYEMKFKIEGKCYNHGLFKRREV